MSGHCLETFRGIQLFVAPVTVILKVVLLTAPSVSFSSSRFKIVKYHDEVLLK
jgi:hypothetical protein